jgi:hypothetical protein
MITTTTEFQDALRSSHGFAGEAIAYPPNGDPVVLPIEDGTVTIDRTADNRRSLSLAVSDPSLYPTKPTDAIAPYGTEVVVKRGIRYAGGRSELVQVGVFRLQDAERQLPGTQGLPLNLWDRSKQVQDARFPAPRKFAAMTAEALIELLIGEVYPAVTYQVTTTAAAATTIPKHVVAQDRWAEVIRVAQAVGCEVFFDAFGNVVVQDVPDPATAAPVWVVDAGPSGVLVSADDKVTRDGQPNIVVATGNNPSGNDDPVTSQFPHGYDTTPGSPTYYLGAYGQVPRFYTNPHIRTQAQANRTADAQLADHLGVSRTVSFGTIPHPGLDAGDAITLIRPDGVPELHIIDTLEIPLSPGGVMTGETRTPDWSAS